MRVKFFEYMTIVNKNGKRTMVNMSETTLPLKHSIGRKVYIPINILGNFREE